MYEFIQRVQGIRQVGSSWPLRDKTNGLIKPFKVVAVEENIDPEMPRSIFYYLVPDYPDDPELVLWPFDFNGQVYYGTFIIEVP